MYTENNIVRVLSNHPDVKVKAGEMGVILCVFTNPDIAYEVEFPGESGTPKVQLTLKEEDLAEVP